MTNKAILAILLASVSFSSAAQWGGGLHYINVMSEGDGPKVNLGGMQASVGYRFNADENFSVIPMVRYSAGIGDDNVDFAGLGIDFKLDRFFALSIRGEYEFESGLFLYAQPTYANTKVTGKVEVEGSTVDASSDDWDFGGGVGVGYQLTDDISADVSYEWIDNSEVFSVGMRFEF